MSDISITGACVAPSNGKAIGASPSVSLRETQAMPDIGAWHSFPSASRTAGASRTRKRVSGSLCELRASPLFSNLFICLLIFPFVIYDLLPHAGCRLSDDISGFCVHFYNPVVFGFASPLRYPTPTACLFNYPNRPVGKLVNFQIIGIIIKPC